MHLKFLFQLQNIVLKTLNIELLGLVSNHKRLILSFQLSFFCLSHILSHLINANLQIIVFLKSFSQLSLVLHHKTVVIHALSGGVWLTIFKHHLNNFFICLDFFLQISVLSSESFLFFGHGVELYFDIIKLVSQIFSAEAHLE